MCLLVLLLLKLKRFLVFVALQFHAGQFRTGLTVVEIKLHDHCEGDGGLCGACARSLAPAVRFCSFVLQSGAVQSCPEAIKAITAARQHLRAETASRSTSSKLMRMLEMWSL